MILKLIRKQPQGNALCGELLIDNRWFCSTLERTDVAIPAGFYPVTLTMSPRFGEVLPLIGNVVGRTGIRIYAGNYLRDTEVVSWSVWQTCSIRLWALQNRHNRAYCLPAARSTNCVTYC